jgi:hypothetical protein
MPKLWTHALRAAYRRELLPPIVLWAQAVSGVRDWIRGLDRPLRPHLGGEAAARALLADVTAAMFLRRYDALRAVHPRLPDRQTHPRAPALAMATLHLLPTAPKARWLWDGLGGAPRGVSEVLQGERMLLTLSPEARWHETATHLGEFLIAFTELAPSRLPRAPQLLAQVCFDMGVRYAQRVRRLYGLPEDADDPRQAIEVLRIGEYIFRVNPDHWSGPEAKARSAFLEGTSCLWYQRPGWQRMHCGIFGQFQAGVCSVFRLDYKLDRTIPKHGGTTCRITMSPLPLTT